MDSALERPRKMGRPRAVQGVGGDDPRAEILDAAAALFTTVGYTRTTTRQIAEAVGLRQGSLFHYFARKQDILDALLHSTIDPALSIAHWLERLKAPPEVKLFLLVRHDTRNLCSLPHNLGTLYFQPEMKGAEFAVHWEAREQLRSVYMELIEEGSNSRVFSVPDVELATDAVFGLVESTCTWFEHEAGRSARQVGDALARAALQMLMPAVPEVHRVEERADAAGEPPAPGR